MNTNTGIEWCDATYSPTRGCSRVSPGCQHCYAERMAARFCGSYHDGFAHENDQAPFANFARSTSNGPRWTGHVELVESKLTEPLRRRRRAEKFLREHGRKPLVFVDSMSDLFHEKLPDEAIDRVFAVMALADWFDFLVLTKRAERMALRLTADDFIGRRQRTHCRPELAAIAWPLPHVRLGVSVEDQQRADERLPHLMKVAAMGWKTVVSAEPLLGPIDLAAFFGPWRKGARCLRCGKSDAFLYERQHECPPDWAPLLGWLIAGGESGPGARPCELAWIRSLRDQAKAAGVSTYIKQLGAHIVTSVEQDPLNVWQEDVKVCGGCDHGTGHYGVRLCHRRGADPAEWPADLRVQERPNA